MAKFKRTENIARTIQTNVVNSIKKDCKPIVKRYLEGLIDKQRDAKGRVFPKKKDSTIKQYKKQGWNTTHWLVRTGESTKLVFKNLKDGLSIKPRDPEDILQYVDQSEDWFVLNADISNDILNKIKEGLK